MSLNAVITGASRGIGRQIALRLARDGYSVAIIYRNSREQASLLAEEIKASGSVARCFECDVSDFAAVNRTSRMILNEFGSVHALVNNAGIAQQALFTDITEDMWDNMLNTNLKSVYACTKAFLPGMINAKSGSILNISSVWGQTGASMEVHYSAAKAGIIGLTKALAKELAPSGINVNCICPGVIQTDMLAGFNELELKELTEQIPMGRLGTADDVAGTASFLLSPAASYITGQIIGVNGGFYI